MTEKKFSFENLTVHFRWVLPIMLGGYIVAYSNDQRDQREKWNDMKIELKESRQALGNEMRRTEERFATIYRQCCSEANFQ